MSHDIKKEIDDLLEDITKDTNELSISSDPIRASHLREGIEQNRGFLKLWTAEQMNVTDSILREKTVIR